MKAALTERGIERGLSPFLPFLKTWLPLIVAFAGETAFGWDFVRDEWHAPAYFEQSNGLFQVAVIDRKEQQIVRYQGGICWQRRIASAHAALLPSHRLRFFFATSGELW